MELFQCIGKNIARIRREKLLTQKQVAERSGMSISYISSLENGHQNPRIERIGKLAQALDVCHTDFFKTEKQA